MGASAQRLASISQRQRFALMKVPTSIATCLTLLACVLAPTGIDQAKTSNMTKLADPSRRIPN
jgi:hypothetical protein